METAYLLTGGNMGHRHQNLEAARLAVELACGHITRISSFYETAPWGISDQPPFLNQAFELATPLSPKELLENILLIEQQLGRTRSEKYGPRTIDIDILFYGKQVVTLPDLSIPHPQLPNRRFALQCLSDIAPGLVHPQLRKTIAELLNECTDMLPVRKEG